MLHCVRVCDVEDCVDRFLEVTAKGQSLLGGSPTAMSTLLRWAARNTRGSTLQVEFSPRLTREKADVTLKGFAASIVFADESCHTALAGILFHYDREANIGTILELSSALSLESRHDRAQIVRHLKAAVSAATAQLDEEAVLNGQLAGCNAVFVCTKTAEDRHRVLHALQIHCVDFPLDRLLEEAGEFSLGILVTPQLPLNSLAGAEKYYVPAILVERFIRSQVKLAELFSVNLKDWQQVQMARLAVRSKIPTVPWSRGLAWMVVDLRDDYDRLLLTTYLKAATMFTDNMPSFDWLTTRLHEDEAGATSFLFVLVALCWSQQRHEFDMVGGILSSYFSTSNCAVIHDWFLARPGKSHNRRHEAARILKSYTEIMRSMALLQGHIAGLDAIFLEAAAAEAPKSNLNVSSDHLLLQKLGFRRVQVDYVCPNLEFPEDESKFKSELLLVLVDENTPRSEFDPTLLFLPQTIVRDLLTDRWGKLPVPPSLLVQVKMQEEHGVPLTQMPWTGGSRAVLVDLYDDFDSTLASAFHKQLAQDTVEPFSVWKAQMGEDDTSPLVLSKAMLVRGSSFSAARQKLGLFELHALVELECQGLNVKTQGGLLVRYYIASNSGVISNILFPVGHSVDSLLIKAREVLDRCARERGFLSGCNAIFLETEAELVSSKMPLDDYHKTFRDAGFRLVGLAQYEAPTKTLGPWSRHHDELMVPLLPHMAHGAMLLAYLGEFVPVDSVIGDFLPANVVRGFLDDRWRGAFESGIVQEAPESNPAFVQMTQSLSAVTKVPLLDLPWSRSTEKEWVYINLGRQYDEGLLTAWYNTVLKPNFPLEDEVESLDSFKKGLLADPKDDDAMLLEIILAVRWEGKNQLIGGGVVYEYYFNSNCGLISFLVVSKAARGQGLSRELVERAAVELNVLSVEDGGALAGCNAIFLETNAAQAVTMEQDVMDPRLRHLIYYKMGFRLVDFPYVMPPLALGKPKVYYLLLLVFMTAKIPIDPMASANGLPERYLPGLLLQRFIHDQWKHAEQYGRLECLPEEDADYAVCMSSLQLTNRIALLDMPWVRSKPWTMIDLREHFDDDLFVQVVTALQEVYPHAKTDLPTDLLRASLVAPLNPGEKSYHIVVALEPPVMDQGEVDQAVDTDSLSLQVVGAIVLEYSPDSNCGNVIFDFCAIRHQYWGREGDSGLPKDLVTKGITILQASALLNGHMVGCSAVFVSVDLGEERLLADQTGMVALITRQNADLLGFVEVKGVHLNATESDALLVYNTDVIPTDDAGNQFLPTKLLVDYVSTLNPTKVKKRKDLLSKKQQWQVTKATIQ